MQNYELRIEISQKETLNINNSGYTIAITKPTHNGLAVSKHIWLSFQAFEINNISWNCEYGVFGSPDHQILPETQIKSFSFQYPAKPGIPYKFSDNAFLPHPPGEREEQGNAGYIIMNQSQTSALFGLIQEVSVNDASTKYPVSVETIPPYQSKLFLPPHEEISVFLHKRINRGGTIIVESDALTLDFGTEISKVIHFNGSAFEAGGL